jgi:hypothetical protein
VAAIDVKGGTLSFKTAAYSLKANWDESDPSILQKARTSLRSSLFPSPVVTLRDLGGRTVVTSTIHDPPFFKFADLSCVRDPIQQPYCTPQSGVDYVLVDVLGKALNFRLVVPSARLTLHFTKLCTKFKIFRKKIFFGIKVTSEAFLSSSQNLKVTRLQGCTKTKL